MYQITFKTIDSIFSTKTPKIFDTESVKKSQTDT